MLWTHILSNELKNVLTIIILIIITAIAVSNHPSRKKVFVPTVVNFDNIPDPTQKNLSGKKKQVIKIKSNNVALSYMAEYKIIGKVASKRKYYSTDNGDVAPYDLAMLWGKLPNKSNDKYIKYSQFGRFYYYKYRYDSPLQGNYIAKHSANCHIVPANKKVLDELKKVKKGDYIELKGYLVNLTFRQRGRLMTLNTSTTRNDTGAGACEIIYVTEIRFLR